MRVLSPRHPLHLVVGMLVVLACLPVGVAAAGSQFSASCSPSPIAVGATATCTATVGTSSHPGYDVRWSSDSPGSFSPTSCSIANTQSATRRSFRGGGDSCFVSYVPSAAGTHTIAAAFCPSSSSARRSFRGINCKGPVAQTTLEVTSGSSAGGGSGAPGFERPIVTSLSPTSGQANVPVDVIGDHFNGVSDVFFGTTSAFFVVDGFMHISAVAPAGPTGTVDVTARNSAGTSEVVPGDRFTYVAPAPAPAAERVRICRRVPTLLRHTYHGAQQYLLRDGCNVPLYHKGHARHGRSHVRSQTPAPGTPLFVGDTVRVVLG